jgi:hypothetical protein
MKAEVYSWRVSAELRMGLEREARRSNTSVAALLDSAAREWLRTRAAGEEDEKQQIRLHQAAAKCPGAFAGGDASRSENASQAVRKRLRRNHER